MQTMRRRSLPLAAATVLALLLAGGSARSVVLAADTREVTFSCKMLSGKISSTFRLGHQVGIVCDPRDPVVSVFELWKSRYTLVTTCLGDDECRFFISIKGARFDPDGEQTDGTLSPGDTTRTVFAVD